MDQELIHFFNNVMLQLGYYEWSLNLVPHSSEGYCWKKSKRIDVGADNENVKRLLLHEIAHIDTCRFVNNKHYMSFWKRYEDLMQRFLPEVSFETKYNEKVGYFRLCYENNHHNPSNTGIFELVPAQRQEGPKRSLRRQGAEEGRCNT